MPRHRLMSDDDQRIELITGVARRRRWTTEQKLHIVDETLHPGETISIMARRHGVAPNLLYRWRRLMTEGGAVAIRRTTGDQQCRDAPPRGADARARTPTRPQDPRGGDPQRGDGPVTDKKTELARDVAAGGRFPMKAVAETLGVARSSLIERLTGARSHVGATSKRRRGRVLPLVRRLIDARSPTVTAGSRRS